MGDVLKSRWNGGLSSVDAHREYIEVIGAYDGDMDDLG